jgi:hypothetical protein
VTADAFERPLTEGLARGDTADRAVAPLDMIDAVGVAFALGGDVAAAGEEDVDRRTGARAGFAIEAGILDDCGIRDKKYFRIPIRGPSPCHRRDSGTIWQFIVTRSIETTLDDTGFLSCSRQLIHKVV